MEEYSLSDDPVPQELLDIQESLAVWNHYKVYFNNETGNILAVANEELPQYQYYFNITAEKVAMLANENIDDYKVVFDEGAKPTLVLKPNQKDSILFLSKVNKEVTQDTELIVEKNLTIKEWVISLRPDKKEEYLKLGVNTRVDFFIVDKDNKNFLIRKISILLKKLYDNKIQVPFDSYREEDTSSDLYVKNFFTSVGLRITYDK